MTTFHTPVFTGEELDPDIFQDTRGFIQVTQNLQFNSTTKRVTAHVPPNSQIIDSIVCITSAVAGIAAGVTLRMGDGTTDNLYGTVSVSAEGCTRMTLAKYCVSAGPKIVIDATAQASAADWNAGIGVVMLTYGSRT